MCFGNGEMAHYEPSHLALHNLHRYLYRSTGLKGNAQEISAYDLLEMLSPVLGKKTTTKKLKLHTLG